MFLVVPAMSPAGVPVTLGWQDPEKGKPECQRYNQRGVHGTVC